MIRATAATEVGEAARMLGAGTPLIQIWRYTILQTLDLYESRLRRLGVTQAAEVFQEEPPLTGDSRVDAAFAALAEHLARREGWDVPVWAMSPERTTLEWWFIDSLLGHRAFALRESPLSFRKRGVFIGERALERA